MDEPEVWQPGDVVLDLYEVRHVIENNGPGRVCQVHHRGWDLDLAVKTPRLDLATPAGVDDFEAEAEAWVALGAHPNMVSCIYVRRLGGLPRVFAEWVHGGTLADRVRDRTLYADDPEQALRRILDVAIQSARGLGHAHRRGMIHHDVKPPNIMVELDWTAKVTDFGMARTRAAARGSDHVTGAVNPTASYGAGTTEYRSPEQQAAVLGDHAARLGRATDVWSWALSVLEMFTGCIPMFGHLAAGMLARFTSADDPVIPAMPPQVRDLLTRCFTEDPAARPQDMDQLADELAGIHAQVCGEPYLRTVPSEATLLADGLSNHALSMVDLGDLARADQLWEEALRADPHHPHAVYNRGLRRWRAGLTTDQELVAELTAVRAHHGDDWIDEYLLALVHLERGDPANATHLLREAQAHGADQASITEALALAARTPPTPTPVVMRSRRWFGCKCAMTDDNRFAALSTWRNRLELWDVTTGQRVRKFAKSRSMITSLAFSANGQVLASGHADGTARIWDVGTGRCARTLTVTPNGVGVSVKLDADGRTMAAAAEDGTVVVWPPDATSFGRRLNMGYTERERHVAVAITADGRSVAAFDPYFEHVLEWEVRTGHLWRGLHNLSRRASFSAHGGAVLAVLDDDSTVTLVNTVTRDVSMVYDRHTWAVETIGHYSQMGMAVSDDGALAVSTRNTVIRLWRTDIGRCLTTLDLGGRCDYVALSGNGELAIAIGPDWVAFVRVPTPGPAAPWSYAKPWDTEQLLADAARARQILDRTANLIGLGHYAEAATELRTVVTLPGFSRHPEVLQHWQKLAKFGRRTSLTATREAAPLTHLLDSALAAEIGCREVLIGGLVGTVTVVDIDSGQPRYSVTAYQDLVRKLAFSGDGRRAASLSRTGDLVMWELASAQRPVAMFPTGVSDISAFALSGDGSRAVLGTKDGVAYLVSCEQRRVVAESSGYGAIPLS